MKRITSFYYKNHGFEIIKKDGFYLAIDHQFIENGILTTDLNGFQMHAERTLNKCLEMTKMHIDVFELMETGMTKAQAAAAVLGIPYTEELEKAFQ